MLRMWFRRLFRRCSFSLGSLFSDGLTRRLTRRRQLLHFEAREVVLNSSDRPDYLFLAMMLFMADHVRTIVRLHPQRCPLCHGVIDSLPR